MAANISIEVEGKVPEKHSPWKVIPVWALHDIIHLMNQYNSAINSL